MWKLLITGICFILIILAYLLLNLNKNTKQPTYNNIKPSQTMKITSPVFLNNQEIPKKYSCDGDNVNPPLAIADVPATAKSLALIVDDPDAPSGMFVHWVLYRINPGTGEIKENSLPADALQGLNGAKQTKYTGPCPPSGTHHYHFKIFALDTELAFASAPDAAILSQAMRHHILDQADLVGLYRRLK